MNKLKPATDEHEVHRQWRRESIIDNGRRRFDQITVGVIAAGALGVLAVGDANAASVIDATMKTALETGFGDLVDTVKDVVGTSWPFLLGAAVILAAPGLVLKLIAKATGR